MGDSLRWRKYGQRKATGAFLSITRHAHLKKKKNASVSLQLSPKLGREVTPDMCRCGVVRHPQCKDTWWFSVQHKAPHIWWSQWPFVLPPDTLVHRKTFPQKTFFFMTCCQKTPSALKGKLSTTHLGRISLVFVHNGDIRWMRPGYGGRLSRPWGPFDLLLCAPENHFCLQQTSSPLEWQQCEQTFTSACRDPAFCRRFLSAATWV